VFLVLNLCEGGVTVLMAENRLPYFHGAFALPHKLLFCAMGKFGNI
jgi:hypothetical protein